jgi:hypothetical protein
MNRIDVAARRRDEKSMVGMENGQPKDPRSVKSIGTGQVSTVLPSTSTQA